MVRGWPRGRDSLVTAGVSAFRLHVGNVQVGVNKLLNKLDDTGAGLVDVTEQLCRRSLLWIHKVGNDPDFLASTLLDKCGHIKLRIVLRLVRKRDCNLLLT
jgi:hypothetical protein